MMKVLHISISDSQGAGLCALRIHKALLQAGVDSKMLVAYKSSDMPSVFVAEESDLNRYVPPKNRLLRQVKKQLRKRGLFLTQLEQYQRSAVCLNGKSFYTFPLSHYRLDKHPLVAEADILHLHWVAGFVDYPTFFPNVDKPIVWTFHDENIGFGGFHYQRDKDKCYSLCKKTEDARFSIKTDALYHAKSDISVVSLSEKMNDFCEHVPAVSRFRHTMIHNCVDGESFIPISKQLARQILGIPENHKVFGFGCLDFGEERKGLKVLVAALERLLDELKFVTLVCAGEGKVPEHPDINVIRLGLVDNERVMSLFYSALDFFMLPSYQEAFAQTPLEAMSCGIPVIAFPCSGTEELITVDNGIRCEDFTVESLMQGIRESLSKQFESDRIRKEVLNRFAPHVIANQYIEVYKTAIGHGVGANKSFA